MRPAHRYIKYIAKTIQRDTPELLISSSSWVASWSDAKDTPNEEKPPCQGIRGTARRPDHAPALPRWPGMPKNYWLQLYPQWKQLEIKDTSLTVTSIHFKHSKGKPLTLTIKGTTSPQYCRLQIMKAYLSVRGATAGTLLLYCPSVPATRAKFNEQLWGVLQFCHFCPKQFKSHGFRIGVTTTAAAQGMSESQIKSLGRQSSDALMKYIWCSQRVSALWTIKEHLHD